jgi:sialate O-acetylesterase
MVLQQGVPIPVWGWDTPGQMVRVTLGRQTATACAATDGRWRVRLDPVAAGGPLVLRIEGTCSVTFADVMVGEVWICSGQSNMRWSVSQSRNAREEMVGADDPGIRLFKVPNWGTRTIQDDLAVAQWEVCSPQTVMDFSAVAYFFGRELRRKLGVPVGLVQCCVGGTPAESWMSPESLAQEPAAAGMPTDPDEVQIEWDARMKIIRQQTGDNANTGWPRGWADLPSPEGDWQEMQLPTHWQQAGVKFNGILWFRKEVDVPSGWAGEDLALGIGACDKSDVTYFNNAQVGSVTMQEREDAWCLVRTYRVPAKLVRPGRNVIAVRVHSDMFAGGMTGPVEAMHLSCPSVRGSAPIPLGGLWRYAVEANYGQVAVPTQPGGCWYWPSSHYCGMVAPLIPYGTRGAIWYQGEANVGRAVQYRGLFQALIRDWRKQWGQDHFAFLFVQLPNYLAIREQPASSPWAELREAQAAALALPETGMAVAIDVGEANDIHPTNKQDVGHRLACSALATVYKVPEVPASGPLFAGAQSSGTGLRITFTHTHGGLLARGGCLAGFALAGADRRFVWAEARIEGDAVIVSSPAVPAPVAVRYAWADNPVCNLYNGANLPAAPFRSDDWTE